VRYQRAGRPLRIIGPSLATVIVVAALSHANGAGAAAPQPAAAPQAGAAPHAAAAPHAGAVPMAVPAIDTSRPFPPGEPSTAVVDVAAAKALLIKPQRPPAGEIWRGAFRITCGYSHMGFDDPIVYPGQPGASHLHTFFGNTTTNAHSTAASLGAGTARSTCYGQSNGRVLTAANRSAYWIPSVIDTRTHLPVKPSFFIAYYKTGFNRNFTNQMVQELPAGFRLIAGARSFTSTDPWAGIPEFNEERGSFRMSCGSNSGPSMPNCAAGGTVRLTVIFPQCWNGQLDSANHRSHVQWPDPNRGCPSTHPRVIPQITLNADFPVPAGTNPRQHWRLASDDYVTSQPGGFSAHADVFINWNMEVQRAWLQTCVREGNSCG
jgi:hypothetical protein